MSDPKPITCDEALRMLAAFLDHELHGAEREGLELHLEVCRSCFSRAEFERRLKGEMRRLGREDVSPAFAQRIRRLLGSFTASPPGEAAGGAQA
jgi:anti-sigma factor (TIGR02949 family)